MKTDITLCTNNFCQLKNNCKRFLTEPNQYLQYRQKFFPIYIEHSDEFVCDFYIPYEKTIKDNIKKIDE